MTLSPPENDPGAHLVAAHPLHAPPVPRPGPPTSGMAVASLVLGIVGVMGGWCTFAVPCILAVVFGFVALGQTRDGARGGRGMAIAGLVLGLIPTAVLALVLLVGGIGTLLAPASHLSSRVHDKATAQPAAAPAKGLVAGLDPITVNLAGGHYLKLGMSLQLAAGAPAQLDTSTAVSDAIDTYTGRDVGALSYESGRAAVKQELIDKIRTDYRGAILDVYFTTFVTQ